MLRLISLITLAISIAVPAFSADPLLAPQPKAETIADGNVFFTDKDGKHYLDQICDMYEVADENTAFTDFNGKRYYFCAAGCAKTFAEKPSDFLEKLVLPANVMAMNDDVLTVACPVSSELLKVNDKTPHHIHEGKNYFFCCSKCGASFAKNPAKFTAKKAD